MIGKPEGEARAIYDRYDRELPFVRQLAARCQSAAAKQGYLELYDGGRRHWDAWEAPEIAWTEGMGPCPREEAEGRNLARRAVPLPAGSSNAILSRT